MNKQTDIGKKVDKALESLDGIQRAEPRPFFFTRVNARLRRVEKNIWETIGSFVTRPVVTIAGLVLVLAINIAILIQKESTTSIPTAFNSENSQLQEDDNIFAANNTSYDYENLEP
jgi:hypothetical protein